MKRWLIVWWTDWYWPTWAFAMSFMLGLLFIDLTPAHELFRCCPCP